MKNRKLLKQEDDNTLYFCIKCRVVAEHRKESKKFQSCLGCGLVGSIKPRTCQLCTQKTYVFETEGQKLCVKCFSGFCPKNVTDVIPLNCLFCEDTLQTWYIYGSLGKMRCQNCEGVRNSEKPTTAEECPLCKIYTQEGLLTYSNITGCEDCFRTQLKIHSSKQKDANQSYLYDCPLCKE